MAKSTCSICKKEVGFSDRYELKDGYICDECFKKLKERKSSVGVLNITNHTAADVTEILESDTSVPAGDTYSCVKSFLTIHYKRIETDVHFGKDALRLRQGTAAMGLPVNSKTETTIKYGDIEGMNVKKKMNAANAGAAAIIALLSIIMGVWPCILISLILLFLGSSAVLDIGFKGGNVYEIWTNTKTEAEELCEKIQSVKVK